MAFNAASVDAVSDACQEIQFLRSVIARNQLRVDELDAVVLTDAERDTIRTRLQARIQNRRSLVIAEVGTW